MARLLATVTPPPAGPPETGLLITAPVVDGDGDAFRQGVTYLPESSAGYRLLSQCLADPVDHYEGASSPRLGARVVTVEFPDVCELTRGRDPVEADARVRRIVAATESFAVARELWTGELSHAEEDADPELVEGIGKAPRLVDVPGANVLSAAPVSPKRALGMLQAAVGRAARGARPFVHVSPEAEPYLDALIRTGNLITTRQGSLVVVDAGYPGTAPATEADPNGADPGDGVSWLYATGRVGVWRSTIETVEGYDTAHNRVRLVGLRSYVPAFDPAVLFAVPITLT